jgi:hypothetical protein
MGPLRAMQFHAAAMPPGDAIDFEESLFCS